MGFQYENAPITEAVVDVRVELLQGPDVLHILESLHDGLAATYPTKKSVNNLVGLFVAGDKVSASATQSHTGFALLSADGKHIVQVSTSGFSLSRLKPYGNWVQLREEARRVWDLYREATSPRVIRAAVRYINQIDMPSATIDYKDYFRTMPEVSPVLPQGLAAFFMELRFPQPDLNGMVVLREAAVPPPSPNMASVVLDLDVYREFSGVVSDEELWDVMESLRRRKNDFFEGSITDRTRALFGGKKEY